MPLPDQSAERDERFEAHVSEYIELDGEMEALEARVSRLHSECNAAREAAEDARDAAELARDAVAAEERTRAAASRCAELAAQRAALDDECEREREESEARLAVARANVVAAEAALTRARACEPVLWESPTETRERLHRHGELVWSMTDERPAPKVFSLVGKSADNVRALAGEVSQEVTGTEERLRLERLGRPPPSPPASPPPPATPHPGGSGPVHTWEPGCTCPGCMSRPPPLTWGIIQPPTPSGGSYLPSNSRESLEFAYMQAVPLPVPQGWEDWGMSGSTCLCPLLCAASSEGSPGVSDASAVWG